MLELFPFLAIPSTLHLKAAFIFLPLVSKYTMAVVCSGASGTRTSIACTDPATASSYSVRSFYVVQNASRGGREPGKDSWDCSDSRSWWCESLRWKANVLTQLLQFPGLLVLEAGGEKKQNELGAGTQVGRKLLAFPLCVLHLRMSGLLKMTLLIFPKAGVCSCRKEKTSDFFFCKTHTQSGRIRK